MEKFVENVADIINQKLEAISHRKTHSEIAAQVGFVNRNMISLLKTGKTKLALDRVPGMAEALEMDQMELLLPALRQYYSEDVICFLNAAFSGATTDAERFVLECIRESQLSKRELTKMDKIKIREAFGLAIDV